MRTREFTHSEIEEYLMDRCIPVTETGCWLWTVSLTDAGYGASFYRIYDNHRAHRISYRHFVGDIPDGMSVCHKCDVRSCINPTHLYVGTHDQNMKDKKERGRFANIKRGVEQYCAKLNPELIADMRVMRSRGLSYRKIAAKVGVTPRTATEAIKGITWKSIQS